MISIRAWLRRMPQPATIRVDGKTVAIPDSPSKWASLEETILSLDATLLEAVGADGEILRAISIGEDADEEQPAVSERDTEKDALDRLERERSMSQIARHEGIRDAVAVAQVVSEACSRAVEQHAATYSRVLERYESLVSLSVTRLGIMERGYHSAMVALAKAQGDAILARAEQEAAATESNDSGIAPMLAQLAVGMLGEAKKEPEVKENKEKLSWTPCYF